MEYEDFVIQLGTGAAGYTVRVSRSPAGETDPEPFLLPVAGNEIDRIATAFGRAARDLQPAAAAGASPASLAALGDRLFRALLPESVSNRYHESLGLIASRQSRGLRLRIQMGLGLPAMAQLHAIPWEYLHASEAGHFLALSRNTSVVRYLDLGMAGDRPPASLPLAILAVAGDDPALDLLRERRAIEQAWSGQGKVRLTLLRSPTLDSLREELLARDYHALHFMGHGGFDAQAGEGSIALRDEEGRQVWVSGAELAEQVRGLSSLRLVVLNACWTARASSSGPYAGVATAMLRAGVPAVLAMQFPITDSAALAFSRTFYRRLARGDTIDEAVTEGRLAIRRGNGASIEWGTPVLFERLTNGRVVETRRWKPWLPPPVRSWGRAAAAGLALLACLLLLWLGLRASPAGSGNQPAGSPGISTSPLPNSDANRKRGKPPAPVPRIYQLIAGEPTFVAELAASVVAEFSKIGQEPYLTLHVTPPHARSLDLAVLGAATIDVDLQPGAGHLVVHSIDWSERSVKLSAEAATARCNDGSYSFSHTHSGSCSHHRGVEHFL
jgi:hypothetical protein